MSLVDQLRSWLPLRRQDPSRILDLSASAHPTRHRDQYLTSEHFHDLSDENDDAAVDDDEGFE
jgi:hypothetical protein